MKTTTNSPEVKDLKNQSDISRLSIFCFYLLIASIIVLAGCATATIEEEEKKILIQTLVTEFNARMNYDNCWTAVGATGIVDQNSRDAIMMGDKIIGGAVVVDPNVGTDLSNIVDYAGVAYLMNADKGVYHIRYPISQQFLFRLNKETQRPEQTDIWTINLKCRYKVVDKTKERVFVRLNRYKLNDTSSSEKSETMMTLDSESFPENPSFQLNEVFKENVTFNFRNYGYFIDAQLIQKTGRSASPQLIMDVGTAIGLIQLCTGAVFED